MSLFQTTFAALAALEWPLVIGFDDSYVYHLILGRKFKDMLNLLALLVLPAVVLFLALTHRRKKLCGEQANKRWFSSFIFIDLRKAPIFKNKSLHASTVL